MSSRLRTGGASCHHASLVTQPATVVVHLDMDAFYAQVEAVRLGVSTDPVAGPPLAVQLRIYTWYIATR